MNDALISEMSDEQLKELKFEKIGGHYPLNYHRLIDTPTCSFVVFCRPQYSTPISAQPADVTDGEIEFRGVETVSQLRQLFQFLGAT